MKYILDANVWVRGLLLLSDPCREIIESVVKGKIRVVVNSYCVAEVTRIFKRVSFRYGLNPLKLEKKLWTVLNVENVIKDFREPLSEDLLMELRRAPEHLVISRLLKIEPKDSPYIVSAYKHKAKLVTTDIKSLLGRRNEIKEKIGVEAVSVKETLKEAR